MISRTTSLSISVCRVKLITAMHAGSTEGHACQSLRFAGTVHPPELEWQTDVWELPGSLSGRLIEITCTPKRAQQGRGDASGLTGWCQFSPVAGALPVQVEVVKSFVGHGVSIRRPG